MTLGDRERRRGKRGHLAFPPLLSEFHRCRRAQLGRALGLGRQPLVLRRGKLRPREVAGWRQSECWLAGPRERADPSSLGCFHLHPLPCPC